MNLKFISSFGSKNYLNYLQLPLCHFFVFTFAVVELVRNRIAHAQKPDFFIRLNGLVHLNRRESQFSRMLAAEVCTSAVVMLIHHVPRSCESTGYPLHLPVSPSLPPSASPCAATFRTQYSFYLYHDRDRRVVLGNTTIKLQGP